MIRFGPAGLGGVSDAIGNLEEYNKLGLRACEIAFTYGVYIKNSDDAKKIGKAAKANDIRLSIHAPYWINLNSQDKGKVEESKKRILDSCKVGEELGAEFVVFHPGYYGNLSKEETYENIKNQILDIQRKIKENNWKIKIAPETTGKVNVFGSIEEISKLVEETDCGFCIDFAHILAREKDYKFNEVLKRFEKYKRIHVHFSGIIYGEKGEKSHKKTEKNELIKLLKALPKSKDITIINESPDPVKDSVMGVKIS